MKLNKKLLNSARGTVFYGMHFYPGVAEYEEPGKDPFRVFINESTIRQMNPTFAGCPIFVEHVDDVDDDINEVREEADGWVLESFFNQADGKTWAKFIVVSDQGLSAIRRGFRLSNAYIPKSFGEGGLWNGVTYRNEVTGGEFEHLAIVRNPRYEESVIMTPEEFKAYNNERTVELQRLANSRNVKGDKQMGLKLFKRSKVENSVDLEGMMVELPLSKKEMKLVNVVDAYDKILNMNGYANGDHMVKVGEKDEMSVNDLVKKHMAACNEIEKLKGKHDEEGDEMEDLANEADEDDDESMDNEDDSLDNDEDMEGTIDAQVKAVGDRGGDVHLANEEDEEMDKKKKNKAKKNSMSVSEAKKVLAREKAARLKNARERYNEDDGVAFVALPRDQVARGKQRYGSN